MCGRFVLETDDARLAQKFDAPVEQIRNNAESSANDGERADITARYNIAPAQIIDAVRQFDDRRIVSGLKWGLVPHWAKDAAIGNRMINARAETLAEKPSFKTALRQRRCLIPASGFYEWKRLGDKAGKQPFYFYLTDEPVFAFAGLWETWRQPGQASKELVTCTIITTQANEVLAPVHDRMPVILKPADYEQWLDPRETNVAELEELLRPYPAEEMKSHAVSRQVNNPSFDNSSLNQAVELNSL